MDHECLVDYGPHEKELTLRNHCAEGRKMYDRTPFVTPKTTGTGGFVKELRRSFKKPARANEKLGCVIHYLRDTC